MNRCLNKDCSKIIKKSDTICPYCGEHRKGTHNIHLLLSSFSIVIIGLLWFFISQGAGWFNFGPMPMIKITPSNALIPTNTFTIPPSPTQTTTLTSTATPVPTKTATIRPTITAVLFPEVYDDFNNPTFDGGYNHSIWRQAGDKKASVIQKNGVIQFMDKESTEGGDFVLFLDQPEFRTVNQAKFFEAKLRIDEVSGSFSFVKIQISSEVNNYDWWTQCRLQTNGQNDASFVCDVYTHSNGNFTQEYQTDEVSTKLNQWYIVRIEIDPKTFELSFFLDGKRRGVYFPKDSRNLLNSRLQPRIGIYTTTGNSIFGSSVDDVKITPK